jgi:alkylated DNA nucleotide flippase Atl1
MSYGTEMFTPHPQWYTVLRALPMGEVSAVIDIGAYVGVFSAAARFLHPNASVLAVEPHHRQYQQHIQWLRQSSPEPAAMRKESPCPW